MKKIRLPLALSIIFHFSHGQSLTSETITCRQEYFCVSVKHALQEIKNIEGASNAVDGFYIKERSKPDWSIKNCIEEDFQGTITLYPNPIRTDLTIDFSRMECGTYTIEIYDVTGKLLIAPKVELVADSYREKIKFVEYANGLYLVKVSNPGKADSKSFRVTKQD